VADLASIAPPFGTANGNGGDGGVTARGPPWHARAARAKLAPVPRAALVSLRLAKEDFAFAAAHFTLFGDRPAERLHGHNYRVRVELSGAELDEHGFLLPVAEVKARIRAVCAALDERVLIPEKSPALELRREGDAITMALEGRAYRFPSAEVALLPVPNVTIEALARHVFGELAPALAGTRIARLRVEVEETAGQSAGYEAEV
jgi:6-pyruvoyltetrahydropterin/6-carboxytetrahydropterin synthase